jgi:hypothetical protein
VTARWRRRAWGPAAPFLLLLFQGIVAAAALFAASSTPGRGAPSTPMADNPHGAYNEECSLCHGAEAWVPLRLSRKFDHAKFGFRLQGAHAQAPCRSCHVSIKFKEDRPATACVSCHQDIHQGEFGTDCARCHSTLSFIDYARMRRGHNLTRFPLSGSHLMLDCGDCHVPVAQGHLQYVNTPAQCVDCHLDDYLATTNPDHQASGIPRDCLQCHDTRAFIPARSPNHDALFFPIYSGVHKGRWSTCSDCHINPNDRTQFECILCHAHSDPVETASHHSGVGGYQYNSQACYSCHPRGRK